MARRRGLGSAQSFLQGALAGGQQGLQQLMQQRIQQAGQPPMVQPPQAPVFQPSGGIEGQAPTMGIAELLKMLIQGRG